MTPCSSKVPPLEHVDGLHGHGHMPTHFRLRASSAHRISCLGLYRALLKQASALRTLTEPSSSFVEPLQHLLRYSFRRDRNLVSPSQIANGLQAGHDALDLLQACNEQSSSALNNLSSLVEMTARKAHDTAVWRSTLVKIRSPTSKEKLPKIAHLQANSTKANQTRYAGSKPVLERPLPLAEIRGGIRRVPYLVATQGIPFLRYVKPQPISLSRYIRQRVKDDIRAYKRKDALQAGIMLAACEDEWDRIVEEQHGIRDGAETSGEMALSWRLELEAANRDVSRKIRERDAKNMDMGRRMWEVVVKERELAEQEKRQRLQAKLAAKRIAQQQQSKVVDLFQGDFGDYQNTVGTEDVRSRAQERTSTTTS